MAIEEHATPILLGELPQLAALEILDATLDAVRGALAAGHPDLGIDDGLRLSDDDPPLPWIAADLLDQAGALQRVVQRYLRAAMDGGSCCQRCVVRQRAVARAGTREVRHEDEA